MPFCPKVGDWSVGRAADDGFTGKAQRGKAAGNQFLATGVVGGDGRAGNQFFGQA